jgi:hypothetical protein
MRFQDGFLRIRDVTVEGNLTVDGVAVFAQKKEPITYRSDAILVGNAEGCIASTQGLSWTDAILTVDGTVQAMSFCGDGSGLANVDSNLIVHKARTDRSYAVGLFDTQERSVVNLDEGLSYEPETGALRANLLVANVRSESVTGVLSVAQGGTGMASVADKELLVGTAGGSVLESTRGLFWDNDTSRLGVGTRNPTDEVQVLGTVRANSFVGSGAGLTGLTARQLSGAIGVACGGTGRSFLEPRKILVGAGAADVESASGLAWRNGRLGVLTEEPEATLDVRGTVHAESFMGTLRAIDVRGVLIPDNIPLLDAKKIASGVLPTALGGTGRSFAEPECVLVGNGNEPLAVAQGVRISEGRDIHARTFHGSGSGLSGLPATQLSGIVPVSSGGTGQATFPESRVLFGGDGGRTIKTSSNLFWDNGAASLGIRNATPEEALDVAGNIKAEAFIGDGSGLTSVPIASLSGVLPVSSGGTGRSTLAANRLLVGSDERHIASTSNLYWDNGTASLGIRNAAPEEALDVTGCIRTIDLKVANEIVSSASDLRLKQNIQKIDRPLDLLDRISGYTFDWNAKAIETMDPRHPKQDVGLIAQEIKEVLPSAVYPCAFDSEYMTVKYEKLVPLLIECIKELRDELRNKF